MGLNVELLLISKDIANPLIAQEDRQVSFKILCNGEELDVQRCPKYIGYNDGVDHVVEIADMRKNDYAKDTLQEGITAGYGQCDYYIIPPGVLDLVNKRLNNPPPELYHNYGIGEVREFKKNFQELLSKLDRNTQYALFSWIS